MQKAYKTKWLLPGNSTVIEDAVLIIENGIIKEIKTGIDGIDDTNIEFSDFGNAVITPGFVNLHTHLQYTSVYEEFEKKKGRIDFVEWIIELVKKYSLLTIEEKNASVQAGLDESLKSGVTCLAQLSKEVEFVETISKSPVEVCLFLEIFSNDKKSSIRAFKIFEEKYRFLKKNCPNNLHIGISPHSIYNVHPVLWDKVIEFALKENILVHTHLAESQAEIDWIKGKKSGLDKLHDFLGWQSKLNLLTSEENIINYIKKLGLAELKSNLILAHLNFLSKEEILKLAKTCLGIAHCPISNINLHGRTFDCSGLSKTAGIGTDSKASSYSLSILDEARFIKSNTSLTSLEILDMLALNGAKILRLDNKKGSLENGKDADFLVFKLKDGEIYSDFLSKNQPDLVYVKDRLEVENKQLTKAVSYKKSP